MDAAEYKHVVLGLIFLKYISDTFEEHHAKLVAGKGDYEGADPEDRDEYPAENVFWVPKEARWSHLQASAKQPDHRQARGRRHGRHRARQPPLKGVLPKDYARPGLDKHRLGELIDLIGTIGLGDTREPRQGLLGRVYEYFLTQFASAEGKNGGQFYTPCCVVRCLVEMLAPYKGRIYDPCCGSGGMFVQSEKFVEAHGGNGMRRHQHLRAGKQRHHPAPGRDEPRHPRHRGRLRPRARRHLPPRPAPRPQRRLRPRQSALQRFRLVPQVDDDVRWQFGVPPKGNANFAWVQHFIHHLAPDGMAGFVLANGSMSSNQSGEGDIRKAIIEADLVDCMVAMPGQLFYCTQIPVCLWFLARNKTGRRQASPRPPQANPLFIDARKLGTLIDRVHRELTDADIEKIVGTYHAWRGDEGRRDEVDYETSPGFCKSATTPKSPPTATSSRRPLRRRRGSRRRRRALRGKDAAPRGELHAQFAESAKLEKAIRQT